MRLLVAADQGLSEPLASLLHQYLPDAAITTANNLDSFIDRVTGEVYDLAAVKLDFGGTQSRVVWDLLPGTSCILLVPAGQADEVQNLSVMPADDFIVTDNDLTRLAIELATRARLGHRRQHSYYSLRQRYEDVTQSLKEIIYELDSDGRFVYLNRSVELLGYTPDELLGRHFTEILDDESARRSSREKVLSSLRGVATGTSGAPGLFDERRRGRRKTVDLEVRLQPKRTVNDRAMVGSVTATGEISRDMDGSQQFVGTLGVIQDITLRRRSEDSLRKLYAIAEEVPASVVVTDANHQIEYANPQFYRTFGVSPEYVVSQRLSDVPAAGFNTALVAGIERACRDGETWRATLLSTADTQTAHGIVARPVMDGSGSCSGLILVIAETGDSSDTEEADSTWSPDTDEGKASLATIVHEALRRFESDLTTPITLLHPRIPADLAPVSWSLAGLLQQLIRDLMGFSAASTTGGTCSLAIGQDSDHNISLQVRGSRDTDDEDVPRDPTDMLHIQNITDRLDETRRLILSKAGRWELRRASTTVEFMVSIPRDIVAEPAAAKQQVSRPSSGHYDISALISSYIGSEEVLREILLIYQEETPIKLAELDGYLDSEDFAGILRVAHSLVNTSGALQSGHAVVEARALERAARDRDIDHARTTADRLVILIRAILAAVRDIEL